MTQTLAEAYPQEQARCRELLQVYRDLGPVGHFGFMAISQVLGRAEEAAASGDIAAMIRCYQEMKECQ